MIPKVIVRTYKRNQWSLHEYTEVIREIRMIKLFAYNFI
jgi:hypothetical protein